MKGEEGKEGGEGREHDFYINIVIFCYILDLVHAKRINI